MDDGQIEVPYVKVSLDAGVMSQKVIDIMAHEIPMLMTTHGEEAVVVQGATGDTRWIDPREEYARLENRYGANKEGLIVRQVFGRFMENRLTDLMDKSLEMFPLPSADEVKAEEERKNPAVKKRKKKKGRTRLKSRPTD